MALRYLADLYGSGGTEMMPAILEALGGTHDPQRLRVVAFMTDGYIGNDYAIIDAVRQHAGTSRVFAFGIGNAVNRSCSTAWPTPVAGLSSMSPCRARPMQHSVFTSASRRRC